MTFVKERHVVGQRTVPCAFNSVPCWPLVSAKTIHSTRSSAPAPPSLLLEAVATASSALLLSKATREMP